ncbi:MAG: RNA polymerase sigma factor [Deltaproteobacteria bacterium]|jgi:RNA polymerase sigma-70 factor (ECF subfamily)
MHQEVTELGGSTLTIDQLVRQHGARVYRMVASLLGPGASDADVQDIAQDVFLGAHRALPRFRGDAKVETWLYGIATRTVLMHLRSWRRRRRLKQAVEAEPIVDRSPDVERTVAERAELMRVWRCLMQIPAKKRVVYVLYEVEGLSGKEVAEALDINEATVRTRLYHARKELMALYEKMGGQR